jgi:hypothetical protein
MFGLQIVQTAAQLQEAISEGATSFLITEYKYMGVFMVRHRVTGYVLLQIAMSLYVDSDLLSSVAIFGGFSQGM